MQITEAFPSMTAPVLDPVVLTGTASAVGPGPTSMLQTPLPPVSAVQEQVGTSEKVPGAKWIT